MRATVRTEVNSGEFRYYALQVAAITHGDDELQRIARALGNIGRYAPLSGRLTLSIEWEPDTESGRQHEYDLPPAKGLGGGS